MRHKILFVDDEPLVLQGLQRMLRGIRKDWDMEFLTSGALALERMEKQTFDAVVTDMRMPGMNGADLLRQVMKRSPLTVRLILSGQTDAMFVAECVGVSHQHLAKPCAPKTLTAVLNRAFAAGKSLDNPRLRELVGQVDQLPCLPSVRVKLVQLLQAPEVDLAEVADIVSGDIAMSATVLKMVNSAYFGESREIASITEAVHFAGVDTLRSLVLMTTHAFNGIEGQQFGSLRLDRLWSHSLAVACTAKRIAETEDASPAIIEQSFVAGMLHDAGRLIFAAASPAGYDDMARMAMDQSSTLREAETEVFGATHAQVGGYLFGMWGLPGPVVETVTLHHQPSLTPTREFSALTTVHVAEALSRPPAQSQRTPTEAPVDLDYLSSLGLADRLEEWTALSRECADVLD